MHACSKNSLAVLAALLLSCLGRVFARILLQAATELFWSSLWVVMQRVLMRRGHIAVMTGNCGTDIVGDSASIGKLTELVALISGVGTSSIKCMAIFISSILVVC